MRAVCGALVLGALAAVAGEAAPFRLEPGDNRYIQFSVTHVPTLMDCTFKVLKGDPSVHMEVMSDVSYRQYIRGRDYEPLASSTEGESGEIRRLLDERGRFDVMLVNTGTAAVVVEMEVRTDLDPSAESLARVLSPERRLTVILVSFGLFFGMVIWAGVKLLRGVNLRVGR